MARQTLAFVVALCVGSSIWAGNTADAGQLLKLTKWERGVKLESRSDKAGFAYLWFYEWHLFGAVENAEHTQGSHAWNWVIDPEGTLARMDADWLKMRVKAAENGADMSLEISNTTDYDWPEIAAIIPCFNPGNPRNQAQQNPIFLDSRHKHTYFLGKSGLELIRGAAPREIHFNQAFHEKIMGWKKERDDGRFVFSGKWPTSERDAYAGLLIRESEDRKWVMGIAWESFISAQGHNPWKCMHLSIRVGPLKKGETKTIRGKMYLFKGSKEDCLRCFEQDCVKGTYGKTTQ